jgi:hypothetical protein
MQNDKNHCFSKLLVFLREKTLKGKVAKYMDICKTDEERDTQKPE